jgi:hypothetical protein
MKSFIHTAIWQRAIAKWRARKQKATAERARICIRSQTHELTGTIEQMERLDHCLRKGCCADPLPVEQMYFDMKQQPVTGLIERKHKGDTGKNEVTHRKLNQLVEHVSRMGEDLMDVRLGFLIFAHNERADAEFGLRDRHAHGVPWVLATLNAAAAGVLEALPFPALSDTHNSPYKLAPLVPIDEDHEFYEPLGFAYLKHEKNAADQAIVERIMAEYARDGQSSILPMPVHYLPASAVISASAGVASSSTAMVVAEVTGTSSSPTRMPRASPGSPSSGRKGGARWSSARKARASTAADLPHHDPTTQEELDLMMQSVTKATELHDGAASDKMYETAAALYLEGVTRAHLGPADKKKGLHPNPTSGGAIKRILQASLKRSREASRERSNETTVAGGTVDDEAVLALMGDDGMEVSGGEQDDKGLGEGESALRRADASAHKPKRQRARDNAQLAKAAHELVFVKRRPLTLTECEQTPRDPTLTQTVMRAYVEAVQKELGGSRSMKGGKKGSPDGLRARIAVAMREGRIASPFVASGSE